MRPSFDLGRGTEDNRGSEIKGFNIPSNFRQSAKSIVQKSRRKIMIIWSADRDSHFIAFHRGHSWIN